MEEKDYGIYLFDPTEVWQFRIYQETRKPFLFNENYIRETLSFIERFSHLLESVVLMNYECLIGTSLSPLVFRARGSGAEIVRTPVLEREELTVSGLTPRGRAKLWLKLLVEKLLPSEVFSSCLASTITLLSTVLIISSSGWKCSTLINILYWSSSYTTLAPPF